MRYVSSWKSSYCTCFHPAKLCSSLKQVFLLTHLTARHGLLNFVKARSWGWCPESRWPWNSKVSFFFKVSSSDSNTAIFWRSLIIRKKNAFLETTSEHDLISASIATVFLIFITCNIEVLDKKKLACYCELRENQWSISHTLRACINEFLTKFLFCLAVSDEIRYRNLRVLSSSICEFR